MKKHKIVKHGPGQVMSAEVFGSNPEAVNFEVVQGLQPDSAGMYTIWPSIDEAVKYGDISVVPVPFEMAHLVGRVIIQSSAVESRVKALVTQLCTFNGTTLDWKLLGKFGQIVTRLQSEAALLSSAAPIGSKLLRDAAEDTRKLHRSRGNLAHGDLSFFHLPQGAFLVAKSKHGEEWFSEAVLRDLALRFCRVWYALKAALDPDYHTALRASPETRFLRGFQASSPLTVPTPPTPPRRLLSSKP